MKKEKIGLALSGGAARGYAQIPIIQKIQKEGIKIDMVSGVSVGALIGAYYALYGEVDTLLEKAKKMSRKEWLKLIDLNNPKKSLIKGQKIKKFLQKEFFGDKSFKDTKIKLVITATDIEHHRAVYITSGKIVDAVMYSLSIPGIFPLNEYKNLLLTDGQISEHLSTDILFKKGASKVLAVDVLKNIKIDIKDIKKSSFNLLLSIFYKFLITGGISNKEKVFLFAPNFTKNFAKISQNLRFDKIEENLKPGLVLLQKDWGDLMDFLKKDK